MDFLLSCMTISFKGFIGTMLWFIAFIAVLVILSLFISGITYMIANGKKRIKIKEDETTIDVEFTMTEEEEEEGKEKTIH